MAQGSAFLLLSLSGLVVLNVVGCFVVARGLLGHLAARAKTEADTLATVTTAVLAEAGAQHRALIDYMRDSAVVGGTPKDIAESEHEMKMEAWKLEAEKQKVELEVKKLEAKLRVERLTNPGRIGVNAMGG